MKYVLLAGMLSLTFACDNSATPEETTPTEQELTPGGEVATEPVMPDASMSEGMEADYPTHFDAAVASFDQSNFAEAADHLQMGITGLETEGVELQGEAHDNLQVVIEEMEGLTERVRAGEVTDRAEITALIQRAHQSATPVQE